MSNSYQFSKEQIENILSTMTFRHKKEGNSRSEYFCIDRHNRKYSNMMQVYLKAYVYTGQMSKEELDTFIGYLKLTGPSANFKEYSAFIRSPLPFTVPINPG
jgi:hypothetical protein